MQSGDIWLQILELPDTRTLQDSEQRDKWIEYSVKDAVSTLRLYYRLQGLLRCAAACTLYLTAARLQINSAAALCTCPSTQCCQLPVSSWLATPPAALPTEPCFWLAFVMHLPMSTCLKLVARPALQCTLQPMP